MKGLFLLEDLFYKRINNFWAIFFNEGILKYEETGEESLFDKSC